MKINLKEFGNLLRAFREARQLTQKDVANEVKCSLTARNLSNIESGKNYPTTQQTIGLCDFLKIPTSLVNDFLSEDFEEKIHFENSISELYGEHVTMQHHDHSSIQVVNLNIKKLNNEELTPDQQLDTFNMYIRILWSQASKQKILFSLFFKWH